MQPNQQYPNQQPAVSSQQQPPLPYQVPDYLHLDPVTGQQKPRKKYLRLIVIATVVALVICCATIAYSIYLHNTSPQQRLYKALENALSVQYVNKKITYYRDDNGRETNVQVNSTVNLSEPSRVLSESKIDFSRQIKRDGKLVNDQYVLRLIKTSNLNIFAESYSGETDFAGIEKNKWIASNLDNRNISTRLEEFDIATVMYGLQTVPIMGNYSSTLRSDIMDMIKSDGMFQVVEIISKDISGKTTTGLKVIPDRDAINKLNKVIDSQTKPQFTYSLASLLNTTNDEDMTLWIDDKNTIVGVDYRNRLQNENTNRITSSTVFTYPNEIKINEPNR